MAAPQPRELGMLVLVAAAAFIVLACPSATAAGLPNRKLLQTTTDVTTNSALVTPNDMTMVSGSAGVLSTGGTSMSRTVTVDQTTTDPTTGQVTDLSTRTIGISQSTGTAGTYATAGTALSGDGLSLTSSGLVASEGPASSTLQMTGTASNSE